MWTSAAMWLLANRIQQKNVPALPPGPEKLCDAGASLAAVADRSQDTLKHDAKHCSSQESG
jgi:hypothetical protein